MKSTPWIVTDFENGKTGKCLRCGEVLLVGLPIGIEVWLAAVKAFCKAHSKCTEGQKA